MTTLISLIALFGLVCAPDAGWGQSPRPSEALDGVDTVLLLRTGKETFGTSNFSTRHGSLTYLFASAETKAEFDNDPAKYAVQMNGLCARMGRAAEGNPSNYAVVDGKIYLFASDACRTRFLASPEKFVPKPPPPMPSGPEVEAQGIALLDKAVAAHGGQALDALTSYREQHSISSPAPPGTPPRTTKIRLMWRFPDGARQERTFTLPSGQEMTIATLVGAAVAASGPVDPAIPPKAVNPAGLPLLQLDTGRQLVPLLRNRRSEGTQVAYAGKGAVAGVSVDKVRLRRGGLDVIINVDAATSRVHSIEFVDKNQQGEFGDYRITFTDYRPTGGVLIPFGEQAVYNGTADPFLSRSIEAADINPALSPTLFSVAGVAR